MVTRLGSFRYHLSPGGCGRLAVASPDHRFMPLVLSMLALVAGPFVYALGSPQPNLRQILDGFVFITVAGLVCVFIIPDAVAAGGLFAVGFLLAGLAFPVLVERLFEKSVREAHGFILVLAAIGLVIHATVDGIALLPAVAPGVDHAHEHGGLFGGLFENQLALGVIVHRIPVSMAIWWSVRSGLGLTAAVTTFAIIFAATGAAYMMGQPFMDMAAAPAVAWFQAFVSGSLVHVVAFGVTHHHSHSDDERSSSGPDSGNTWAYRVGILIGMFLVFTTPHIHA